MRYFINEDVYCRRRLEFGAGGGKMPKTVQPLEHWMKENAIIDMGNGYFYHHGNAEFYLLDELRQIYLNEMTADSKTRAVDWMYEGAEKVFMTD